MRCSSASPPHLTSPACQLSVKCSGKPSPEHYLSDGLTSRRHIVHTIGKEEEKKNEGKEEKQEEEEDKQKGREDEEEIKEE